VRVAIEENQALFCVGADGAAAVMSTNLVEGSFPPFEDVIPKDQDKRVTFDAEILRSAIKRAALWGSRLVWLLWPPADPSQVPPCCRLSERPGTRPQCGYHTRAQGCPDPSGALGHETARQPARQAAVT
jgi:hypothetical protein